MRWGGKDSNPWACVQFPEADERLRTLRTRRTGPSWNDEIGQDYRGSLHQR